MNTAIAIFGWRRPHHLAEVFKSLSANKEIADLPVYIFLDGPRTTDDEPYCVHCLHHAQAFNSSCSKQIIRATINKGLFNSIIEGVSFVLLRHETVIVLEDDIVVSPYFLSYMLQGLSLYQGDNAVASIHAYLPKINFPFPASFFLPGADCWGWATWREQWKCMRFDAHALAHEIRERKLVHRFNLNQNYDYLRMLDQRSKGLNSSWAILWHASCFLAGKVTLYPGTSLVSNIGFDGTGENCTTKDDLFTVYSTQHLTLQYLDPLVDDVLYNKYAAYFRPHSLVRYYLRKVIHFLYDRSKRLLSPTNRNHLRLHGPFASFEAAMHHSAQACDPHVILRSVTNACTDLLEGKGSYVIGSTLLTSKPSPLPISLVLSEIFSEEDGTVIDFGGGLGGTYLNHRNLFTEKHLYCVVEQATFVSTGIKLARKYCLPIEFYDSFNDIGTRPLMIIFSSGLQYLSHPFLALKEALHLKPKYLLIDRLALRCQASTNYWLQDDTRYYGAKTLYPISPLLEVDLLAYLETYLVRRTWHNSFDPSRPAHRGYLFERFS